MKDDLLIVFSSPPIENIRIDNVMYFLHNFTKEIIHILIKYAIKLAKSFCKKTIVCEAQEGAYVYQIGINCFHYL